MKIDIAKAIEQQIRDDKATAVLGVTRVTNKYGIGDRYNEIFKQYLSYHGYLDGIHEQNLIVIAMEVPDGYHRNPIREHKVASNLAANKTEEQLALDRVRENLNRSSLQRLKDMSGISSLRQKVTKVMVTIMAEDSKDTIIKTIDGFTELNNRLKELGAIRLKVIRVLFQIITDRKDSGKYTVMLDLDIEIEVRKGMPNNVLHIVAYGAEAIDEILNKPLNELIESKMIQLLARLINEKRAYCLKFDMTDNIEVYANNFYGYKEE